MAIRKTSATRTAVVCAALLVGTAAVVAGSAARADAAAASYSVTSTINVPGVPLFAAADGALGRAYATDVQGGLITVDTTRGRVLSRVPAGYPYGLAANETTHRVYVADYNETQVLVFDEPSNTRTATVPVTGTPFSVAVDPVRNLVVVGSFGTTSTGCATGAGNCPGYVTVIDAGTNTVLRVTRLAGQGGPVAVDPTTHRIYATSYDTESVSAVDELSGTITATIGVPQPNQIELDPTRGRVYVGTRSGMTIIDEASNTVVGTIALIDTPGQFAVDPQRQVAFVGNHDDKHATSVISVVDLTDDTVAALVPLGPGSALGVAVDTTTHAAYVSYSIGKPTGRFDVITQAVRTNVTQVLPAAGPTSGGQQVTIKGEHLTGATRVMFGNVPAASFRVNNDNQITAVSPPHSAGQVYVRVTTRAGGSSAKQREDRYTFTTS